MDGWGFRMAGLFRLGVLHGRLGVPVMLRLLNRRYVYPGTGLMLTVCNVLDRFKLATWGLVSQIPSYAKAK